MDDMSSRISARRGHQIGILEEFAEFRCRLHGAKQSHSALGSHLAVVEDPFQILARHSGAGADQVLDEHAVRGFGVAKLEAREQFDDRGVPGDPVLVDQFGKKQRRHRLGIRGDHKQRATVWLLRTAQLLNTETTSEYDLASLHHAESDAGYSQSFLPLLNEAAEFRNARRVQGVGRLSSKGFAAIAFGKQAAENEGELSAAFSRDR